jgi:hypothetical protein
VVIEWRSANGDNERIPEFAAELVQRKPDVIVVDSTPGAQAVKRATSTKKRRYNRGPRVARADIPETQQKIIAHLGRDVAGPPVTLRDIGNLLGFSGSPSNVYQRVLRIIGPMRGERLDWGRGRGKGIYLLHSRKNGSNGNGAGGNGET